MNDVHVEVTVDHGLGPTAYAVTFYPEGEARAARFEFELVATDGSAAVTGVTSPDDWTTGWLTWASRSQIIVAFAAPYLDYAGWLVLDCEPPDEVHEEEPRYWEAVAAQLVTHTFALDRPGNVLSEAVPDARRLPQGRAYSAV